MSHSEQQVIQLVISGVLWQGQLIQDEPEVVCLIGLFAISSRTDLSTSSATTWVSREGRVSSAIVSF